MSIRARIAVFGTLVVAMALLVFGVLLDLLVTQSAPGEQDDRLRERAAEVVAALAVRPLTGAGMGPGGALSLAPIDIRSSDETFVVVTDAAGETIAATGTIDGVPPRFALATLTGAAEAIGGATVDLGPDAEVRIAVSGLGRTDLGQSGYVVAGQSTRPLAEDRLGLRVFVLTAGLIALVTAFAASWRVAGRALRPLRAILRTVDEIAASGELGRRLPAIPRRDELGRLTTSTNAMLGRIEAAQGRLEAALANEQRFVADASHELRTPLTSIRANATFLRDYPNAVPADRDAAVRDIAAEAAEMSALVDDLITLARSDAGRDGLGFEGAARDLRPLLAGVVDRARRVFPGRSVTLDMPDGPVVVWGNAGSLRRLVWILVENAARHTDAPGSIWVGLATHGGQALISVADEGPGLPPGDLERVFDRFVLGVAARGGGVGLGLSIARALAEAHGGAVVARNNVGRGATFVVGLTTVG